MRKDTIRYQSARDVIEQAKREQDTLIMNQQSGNVAYQTTRKCYNKESGHYIFKVQLQRPSRCESMSMKVFDDSQWAVIYAPTFTQKRQRKWMRRLSSARGAHAI